MFKTYLAHTLFKRKRDRETATETVNWRCFVAAVCREFLDQFFSELSGRFPDSYIHLGGDEVNTDCFNASASVRRWVAAQGPNATLADVYVYFETRVHALAAKHGKRVQTWHNAFYAVEQAVRIRYLSDQAAVPRCEN